MLALSTSASPYQHQPLPVVTEHRIEEFELLNMPVTKLMIKTSKLVNDFRHLKFDCKEILNRSTSAPSFINKAMKAHTDFQNKIKKLGDLDGEFVKLIQTWDTGNLTSAQKNAVKTNIDIINVKLKLEDEAAEINECVEKGVTVVYEKVKKIKQKEAREKNPDRHPHYELYCETIDDLKNMNYTTLPDGIIIRERRAIPLLAGIGLKTGWSVLASLFKSGIVKTATIYGTKGVTSSIASSSTASLLSTSTQLGIQASLKTWSQIIATKGLGSAAVTGLKTAATAFGSTMKSAAVGSASGLKYLFWNQISAGTFTGGAIFWMGHNFRDGSHGWKKLWIETLILFAKREKLLKNLKANMEIFCREYHDSKMETNANRLEILDLLWREYSEESTDAVDLHFFLDRLSLDTQN